MMSTKLASITSDIDIHNKIIALERSVINNRALKPVLMAQINRKFLQWFETLSSLLDSYDDPINHH